MKHRRFAVGAFVYHHSLYHAFGTITDVDQEMPWPYEVALFRHQDRVTANDADIDRAMMSFVGPVAFNAKGAPYIPVQGW